MNKIFSPSFAKILSTPVLFVVLLIIFLILNNIFFQNVGLTVNLTIFLLGVIFTLLVAYGISCLIWQMGKNNRKLLIFVFTIFGSLALYFAGNLIIAFFGLCMSNLTLPCLSNSPCQEYTPPCATDNLLLVVCVLLLGCGILLFIKEGKSRGKKSKK